MSRVVLVRCTTYDQPEVEAAIARLMTLADPDGSRIAPGRHILVKPNLLFDSPPDRAVTTHPIVVRALLRFLKQEKAIPVVADSPAGALRTERVWKTTGIRDVCESEHVPLLNLEEAGAVPFEFEGIPYAIARPVLEADLVLNVPKVKTHVLTVLTAGVKNLYGVIPGFQKALLHRHFSTPRAMGRFLAHLARQIAPALTVADAIVGMDGDGPSGGHPCPLGFLAAASDVFALDLALCHLLAIPTHQVPYLPLSGPNGHPRLDWVGDCIPQKTLSFTLPATWRSRLIPPALARLLSPLLWIRPTFDASRCIRCGRCSAGCPVRALIPQKASPPRLLARRCIGCCCCHELCPVEAIHMTESPLMRLISRGRLT